MLKFKFNYQQNTLAYQKGEYWYEITEYRQCHSNLGGSGFKLSNGWITFNVYQSKIRVFGKIEQNYEKETYYQKDLSKEYPVIFTFTAKDEVEKVNDKWQQKFRQGKGDHK